jgi:NAD(P)-dependent dehydrogenase (short-subunit alcohol dehydrogenase family)
MKNVILITGASSGFGAMTARALADAGHVVYASMRDVAGRNRAQAATTVQYATERVRQAVMDALVERDEERELAWRCALTSAAIDDRASPFL